MALWFSATNGTSIWKVEPLPKVDSTQMRPPCISTICLAMARPRPVPPLVGKRTVDLMELLEDTILLVERYAGAGVRHRDGEVAVARARGDAHLAGVGELDGVAYEVEQHLREALLVPKAKRERLVHGCRQRELLVLGE